MKTVILCGGLGTRLSEETVNKPKPLVKIGKYPIIWHIINIYKHYGFKDFILATGFKEKMFKKYFQKNKIKGCNIKLVNTGLKTQTGGRLLALKKYLIGQENFMLTYGDGLSNVNIKKLVNFHKKKKSLATVTAVHPPVRFGELKIQKDIVIDFKEKAQTKSNWISGGFFVFNKKIFDLMPSNSNAILEEKTFTKLVKIKKFNAFKHENFWQCMDTLREKRMLDKQWKQKKAKWKIW